MSGGRSELVGAVAMVERSEAGHRRSDEGGRRCAFLAAVARRLKVAWGFATGQALAPLRRRGGALAAVGFGFLAPVGWAEPLALGIGVSAAVAVLVWAVLLRVPVPVAARAADRGLAHQGRLRHRPANCASRGHRRRFGGPGALRPAPGRGLASGARAEEAAPLRVRRRLAHRFGAGRRRRPRARLRPEPPGRRPGRAGRRGRRRRRRGRRPPASRPPSSAADLAATEAQRAEAEALEQLAEELDRTDSIEECRAGPGRGPAELAAEVSSALEAQRAAAVGLERSLAAEPLPGAPADAPASE